MNIINKIKNFLGTDIKEDKYALVDDPIFGKVSKAKAPDKWVRSTCGYCGVGCGMYIGVKNGEAVYSKGDPKHPVNMGTLCPKGLSEHKMVRASNRVGTPLLKKDGKLETASWSEVFTKTSDEFKRIQKEHGKGAVAVISTGQLLTEEFYALGKFTQLGLETNNYDGNTTLCMASAVMGYKQTFGSDGPTGCYEDFTKADVILLIGANIADNHPILKLHIAKNAKENGRKPTLIVVDPRKSKTAQMADIFVPISPRSDLALLNGLCHIIMEQGWEDEKFIKSRTSGYKEFKKHIIKNYPPQEVSNITGIDVKDLYNLAKVYATANSAMSAWTMGVNQSTLGTDTVSAICNLALITGNLGKEGSAPMSITGQCNAMGTREFGFTSSIPGYRNYASQKDREDFANIISVPTELIPTARGYAYPQIIDAINSGEIKALWVVATNPLVSYPDQNALREALKKLDILVVQDSFMSDTAEIADVVFAAATWSEKEGCYTNSERRCNYAKKAIEPLKDSKSDLDIVLEFSKYFEGKHELLFKNIKTPKDVFSEIKRVSKGQLCDYSGMDYELIEELGGIQWPCNEQAPKGTKRLYSEDMPCPTSDGKAKLLPLDWKPLSEMACEGLPLILNTGRTVEQFHTRTKTGSIGILDNLAPEAWVDINPADAKQLKVKSGDRIDISGSRGKVKDVIVKVSQTQREGNIFVPFHFNEQLINNVTIPEFDPKSFEPNYKQCAVQLHSQKVPEGIKYPSVEVSGYIEDIKVRDKTLSKEKVLSS
ncbi:Assimilatory nitrate reductase large subunit [hydrothermal vent metagenome]|uniref:Assimilatory nitrate reductase large subunit n=1 Tax=hydrothermal vent metagenome TaxID=652676 RepID=A0A1W1EET0_9ZZZZ